MKPRFTVADYAAIAVAPALIFLMISALASFLMLLLYDGEYPGRVTWTILMYTLGAVAIARIAIEHSRAYSLGYAAALGAATFLVMLRFVGAPLFSLLMLALIAYLADLIVRDCTIIDDSVDASDQGLMDAAGWRVQRHPTVDSASTVRPRRTHQPGRTVMYLAVAALPLFGLGHFVLQPGSPSYAQGVMRLLVYLFAALALLVTTSFLGLRRYLRQRGAEMPGDVAVSWLLGGVALIAVVLWGAFLVPRPGAMLAAVDLSPLIQSTAEQTASRWGWGDEAAQRSRADAATTAAARQNGQQESDRSTTAAGGQPGAVGEGNREQGPAGNRSGGTTATAGDGGQPRAGDGGQPPADDASAANGTASGSPDRGDQPGDPRGAQPSPGSAAAEPQPSADDGSPAATSNPPPAASDRPDAASDRPDAASDRPDAASETSAGGDSHEANHAASAAADDPQQPRPAGGDSSWVSRAASGFSALFKFGLVALLAGIVMFFLWQQRDRLKAWWRELWGLEEPSPPVKPAGGAVAVPPPPRPFSSYRNPIGSERDPRRIVVFTFQALEAWARDQGTQRRPDETPAEFVRRLAAQLPEFGIPAAGLVQAYNRIVYGRGGANSRDVANASSLWQLMRPSD